MDKRGLSPVIAVVLLIMITIVAIGIIASFLIPFIRDSLGEGKECFEVLSDLHFAETPYNCYDDDSSADDSTGFSIGIDDERIKGFSVALISGGSSDAIDIIDNTDGDSLTPKISIFDGSAGGATTLTVPKRGGIRTYIAEGIFDRIEIYPILESGNKCDLSDSIELRPCDLIDLP